MTEEKRTQTYQAALAGLLHDIGKFAQRAGWEQGRHTDVGADFVSRYVPEPWRAGLYPVLGHHDKPLQGRETKVVALADRLSAGERSAESETQPRQLLSIISRLELGAQRLEPEAYRYWPLKPLALAADVIFPRAPLAEESAVRQAYAGLWEAFIREVETLAQAHQEVQELSVYLESLLLLLQRYTWCVPSAYYRSLPDVSLYDHARTTAALAVCLDEQPEAMLDALLHDPEQGDEPVALLVGGDISGVQDFIYTITARGATSALRGRSFYLQLLTEALARYVLRELELPITNLLYQGGGNFYLLARPSDQARLEEIHQKISRILLAHHRGELYLALGAEPLRAADFFWGQIAQKWEQLARHQQQAKQRRFSDLGETLVYLFSPQGEGGTEHKECNVCGREHADIQEDQEREVRKCRPCREFEALGKDLRTAEFLWLEAVPPSSLPDNPLMRRPGDWQEVLRAFGLRAGVVAGWEALPAWEADSRVILALNDAVLGELAPGARTAVGRRFLVNVTPTLRAADIEAVRDKIEESLMPDTVKPFSVLEVQARGIERLGVLRMDVDDLGRLFSDGFGSAATLSRVTALSFTISLFFEGWVTRIAEAVNARLQEERGDVLYSIYSGGDDLFFVGAWDAVVELAREIRVDLGRFAAGHPALHASAGIALVGGKYPLYQAAADAGEAEDAAKHHPGKDAVTFLGQTLAWEKFGLEPACEAGTDTVHGLRHHLERLVLPEGEGGLGASSALLRRLIQLQMQYEDALQANRRAGTDVTQGGESQGVWGPWMWRGYYSLKRMAGKEPKTAKDKAIDALTECLHDDDFKGISWIGLAARWVDLLTRKRKLQLQEVNNESLPKSKQV